MHGRVGPSARVALTGLIATVALALGPTVAQAEWDRFAEHDQDTDRNPAVAIDAEGNATAVWESGIWRHTTRWQVWTASRPAGGEWSEAELLAPVAGVDQQTLGGDFLGPRLNDVTVPATATAGEPVEVSVDPVDVWSEVHATEWDFGDGGSAVGASASHAYLAAGTYTVTVTATDTYGHATTETREIVVSEAAREPEGREPEGREPEGRA